MMLNFIKKAVVGRTPSPDFDRDNLVRDEYVKKLLKEELAAAIKRLQRNHINTEHVIDRADEDAMDICDILEGIFLHGYKDRSTGMRGVLQSSSIEEIKTVSFWDVITEISHSGVITELNNLMVNTKVGMCRAWVRLALNDGLIESYLDAVNRNRASLRVFYSSNAFLMDTEALPIAIELLQGLLEFQFQLNYNSSKLDEWSLDSLRLAGIVPGERRKTADSDTSSIRERQFKGLLENRLKASSFTYSDHSPDRSRTSSDADKISEAGRPPSNSTTTMDSLVSTTSEDTNTGLSTLSSSSCDQSSSIVQTVGNRLSLGDDTWSGWSSAFDSEPNDAPETPKADKMETFTSGGEETSHDGIPDQPSFNSLLQTYGAPTPLHTQSTPVYEREGNSATSPPIAVKQPCPISPSEDQHIHEMNYEVVPPSSSLKSEHNDEKTQFLLDHVTTIGLEKGLDKQNFQCAGCGRPIGLIYGLYRVCYYDGGYYCVECHSDEEHTIPAKIIHNWDFKPYKVTKITKSFLMKIEEEPLFHIDEINPTLYNAVPDLNEVKLLRVQLQHLKGYILTCKTDIAEDFRKRLWPREYMCDDIHQYSALDLVQVHTGQLTNHLRKVVTDFSKHIYKCSLCSQKGFICELCSSDKIIYPFEILTTVQCHRCQSVYHKKCKKDRTCAKCLRLQFRRKKGEKKTEILDVGAVMMNEGFPNEKIAPL